MNDLHLFLYLVSCARFESKWRSEEVSFGLGTLLSQSQIPLNEVSKLLPSWYFEEY